MSLDFVVSIWQFLKAAAVSQQTSRNMTFYVVLDISKHRMSHCLNQSNYVVIYESKSSDSLHKLIL